MSDDELAAIVQQWLAFAEEDLQAAARVVREKHPARHAGFAAQQAAEKSIKALLISRNTPFPKTHSLELLNDLLPADLKLSLDESKLSRLSEWAVESRYPGQFPQASHAEAEAAVELATMIYRQVVAMLKK